MILLQINGFSFVTAGVFRNLFMFQGYYFLNITDMQCLFHTPWAILMIVAGGSFLSEVSS